MGVLDEMFIDHVSEFAWEVHESEGLFHFVLHLFVLDDSPWKEKREKCYDQDGQSYRVERRERTDCQNPPCAFIQPT